MVFLIETRTLIYKINHPSGQHDLNLLVILPIPQLDGSHGGIPSQSYLNNLPFYPKICISS